MASGQRDSGYMVGARGPSVKWTSRSCGEVGQRQVENVVDQFPIAYEVVAYSSGGGDIYSEGKGAGVAAQDAGTLWFYRSCEAEGLRFLRTATERKSLRVQVVQGDLCWP